MTYQTHIPDLITPLRMKHLLPAYLPRLARMILRKAEVDLEVGHVFVATQLCIDNTRRFHITNVGAGTLYTSDHYADAGEMVHDLITVLLEGLPEDE